MGSKFKTTPIFPSFYFFNTTKKFCYLICLIVICVTFSGMGSRKLSTTTHVKTMFEEVYPQSSDWSSAMHKIHTVLAVTNSNKQSLIIINVGDIKSVDSLDVFVNNMKILTNAILQHSSDSEEKSLYVFNVISGDRNPLYHLIPTNLNNVVSIAWNGGNSDMDTHIRTIRKLDTELLSRFSVVVFMNQGVRGPMMFQSDGKWIGEYRRLLDANNVGLAGSTISCENNEPHVQTHIFAMKMSVIKLLFLDKRSSVDFTGASAKSWQDVVSMTEVALSKAVLNSGHNISALLYEQRNRISYFDGHCIPLESNADRNPTTWCDIIPQETVFMKWGGEPLRTPGILCDQMIDRMRHYLEQMSLHQPSLGLLVPETLHGGNLYDLYKQYDHERKQFVERKKNKLPIVVAQSSEYTNKKVCFLARSASMHDSERIIATRANNYSDPIIYGIKELAESLIAQDNPNWLAFIFQTDPAPFADRLKDIVASHYDSRLRYVAVPTSYLPVFTKTDAGYTATDYILQFVLQHQPECHWVSATNGDNAYGSGVVQSILSAPSTNPMTQQPTKMLLAPTDSRNFAEQDYDFRKEKLFWFKRDTTRNKPAKRSLRNTLIPKSIKNEWDMRCEGIRANMEFNLLAYAIQPRPRSGKVDLASVFYASSALKEENILFGNFTNPAKFSCLGCQDGYMTEYLVNNRLWNYQRLPIDGLKSLVFHGPSPTLCIASGNIWFDHPNVEKVNCFARKTVTAMHKRDGRGKLARYDWNDYFKSEPRICLRLSKHSFPIEPVSIRNA